MEIALVFGLGLVALLAGVIFKVSRGSNQRKERLEEDLMAMPKHLRDKILEQMKR